MFICCWKQQLLFAQINHTIYFSQSQLLLLKTNEQRTTSQKALLTPFHMACILDRDGNKLSLIKYFQGCANYVIFITVFRKISKTYVMYWPSKCMWFYTQRNQRLILVKATEIKLYVTNIRRWPICEHRMQTNLGLNFAISFSVRSYSFQFEQ